MRQDHPREQWLLWDPTRSPVVAAGVSRRTPFDLIDMIKTYLPARLGACVAVLLMALSFARAEAPLRPPAVPLVACDPYFSIWSPADHLTAADTVHWTGKPNRLGGLIRIDGKPFRVIGSAPKEVPALQQISLEVLPTRTIYSFQGGGISAQLTFTTAALPEDIAILSRPVTYLSYEFKAIDGQPHQVALYFDASAELTVNQGQQEVRMQAVPGKSVTVRAGSLDQAVLRRKGDDVRIDWGYLYLSANSGMGARCVFGSREAMESSFAGGGNVDKTIPAATTGAEAAVALVFPEFKVAASPVSRWLILAYDDLYSIQYMKKNLRPYWRRNGWEAADLLRAAAKDRESLGRRCEAFDRELMHDLTQAGGEQYARIAALAYRQCFAAGKFVADDNGQPLQFCKENHSNGCIGTSDVFYPMAPQFLLFGPSLAKSFLVPFMNYAASSRWRFPFAPHDLGTYPQANGQVYGGGERTEQNQMPVEETGNLMLLMGAVAQMEGNAEFASRYWPQLQRWAEYLKTKGFDPENQLCTDDFAGHLAHNVNLSAKAICGLGAFAKLCQLRGESARADEYFALARSFVERWIKEADDGEKYRLAFDRPGTWSQKYNLIWDRILGLDLFPASVARKEMNFYKGMQNTYGLPLDNRKGYTKLDWIIWSATLTQDRADFEALVAPVYRFLNEAPDRAPMTDWYQTKDAKKVGFTARPVVGGVFARMLYEKAVWKKYAGRDRTRASRWAAIPPAPKLRTVVPAADLQPAMWRYTTQSPAENWYAPEFDSSAWAQGKGGFGTAQTPGAVIGTTWDTSDIWLRREVTLTENDCRDLQAWLHHDESAEVYVNGVLALRAAGYATSYETLPFIGSGKAAFKPGTNVLAIHCHQTTGGQYIDLGLVGAEVK